MKLIYIPIKANKLKDLQNGSHSSEAEKVLVKIGQGLHQTINLPGRTYLYQWCPTKSLKEVERVLSILGYNIYKATKQVDRTLIEITWRD